MSNSAAAPRHDASHGPAFWCSTAVIDGRARHSVRIETDPIGRIRTLVCDAQPRAGDTRLGTVLPGMASAHSHAFHRVLRGRTHADGGDFWQWRARMYAAANVLDPDLYRALAIGVFKEMLAAGYTAVGEFHYVHHQPGGSPYLPAHALELALAEAAASVGIRLALLDTLYLVGGIDQPLSPEQQRFGDGTAERWLDRWHALRDALSPYSPLVTLGAALHSVRAVPPAALAVVAHNLSPDVALHVHVSEQPLENTECLARYGVTPTRLLADAGLLSPRLSAVHATHLTDEDVALLGAAHATIVMCPTTEADLGDGTGVARRLADAGARIALGSDQNAVIDPFVEMRGLESAERLTSGLRGRFTPAELLAAASTGGYASLGLTPADAFTPGAWADWVEIDTASVRTAGGEIEQIAFTATSSDVLRIVVGGRLHPQSDQTDTAATLGSAIAEVNRRIDRSIHG